MASKQDLGSREMESYVDTGIVDKSVQVTLSATPETVTTVTFPGNAKGFRLKTPSYDARFAINATVAAIGTSSDTAVAASVFTNGGILKAGETETRLLPPQVGTTARYITLSSLTASVVIDIEVF